MHVNYTCELYIYTLWSIYWYANLWFHWEYKGLEILGIHKNSSMTIARVDTIREVLWAHTKMYVMVCWMLKQHLPELQCALWLYCKKLFVALYPLLGLMHLLFSAFLSEFTIRYAHYSGMLYYSINIYDFVE